MPTRRRAAKPIVGAPQTNGLGSVNQNYLEASNVDVVQAMVSMISAERAYQLGTQAASRGRQPAQLPRPGSLRRMMPGGASRAIVRARWLGCSAWRLPDAPRPPGPAAIVKPAEFPVQVRRSPRRWTARSFRPPPPARSTSRGGTGGVGDLVTINIVTSTTAAIPITIADAHRQGEQCDDQLHGRAR